MKCDHIFEHLNAMLVQSHARKSIHSVYFFFWYESKWFHFKLFFQPILFVSILCFLTLWQQKFLFPLDREDEIISIT